MLRFGADLGIDFVLEGEDFEDVRGIEPHIVGVRHELQFGGDVDVESHVDQTQAGIHKVTLSLNFAGAEVGNQGFRVAPGSRRRGGLHFVASN